jgi:O-antigen/teichoic acid export membrane protein
MAASWAVVRKQFARSLIARLSPAQLRGEFRDSAWWAADSGLSYLTGQIDGPILASALGLAQAGIYQSGNRFVQAACAVAVVLSNIHIPRLAADGPGRPRIGREWRIYLEFVALGAAAGMGFVLFGPLISRFLLGPAYAEVDQLWLGFGAFVFARYLGAAMGVSLSAHSRPSIRVAAQLCGLLVLAGGFAYALPRFGLVSAPWVMAMATMVIAIIYAAAVLRFNLGKTA